MNNENNQTEAKKSPDAIIVSIKTIRDSLDAISALGSQPIRASGAFRLKNILRQTEDHLKSFNEVRVNLCKESGGVLDEETNTYKIPEDKQKLFDAQFEDLVSQEVTITAKPLRAADISDARISAGHLMQLEWMFADILD